MSLVVMGVSYKTAHIDVRAKYSVPEEAIPSALEKLVSFDDVNEALILSTCNRVEAYVNSKSDSLGAEALRSFFRDMDPSEFDDSYFYLHRGMSCVGHLMRVVCSLDSQMLGEAQILGQIKQSFDLAIEAGTCGEFLTQLFKSALRLGKQARSQTSIGSDSVSLSTTAVKAVKDTLGELDPLNVLIVGSGEMARVTANYFCGERKGSLTITSRTLSHAQALADTIGCDVLPFSELYQGIEHADAVFSVTGSPTTLIGYDELVPVIERRAGRPLVFVDEAVPRDVDPKCSTLPGVSVFDLEALSGIIDEGMATRLSAVGDVERMVSETSDEFFRWMQGRLVTPTIRDIHNKAEQIVDHEHEHVVKSLRSAFGRDLTEDEQKILHDYGNAIAKKILHGPTIRLRREASDAGSYYYTGAARYLFGLDTYPYGSMSLDSRLDGHCFGDEHPNSNSF